MLVNASVGVGGGSRAEEQCGLGCGGQGRVPREGGL